MIVQCPKCETKYNVPEERLKPGGSKVRCTRCGNVFLARSEPEEPDRPDFSLSADEVFGRGFDEEESGVSRSAFAEEEEDVSGARSESREPEPETDSFDDFIRKSTAEAFSGKEDFIDSAEESAPSRRREEDEEAPDLGGEGAFSVGLDKSASRQRHEPFKVDVDSSAPLDFAPSERKKSRVALYGILGLLVVLLIGLGAAWYFKAFEPRSQAPATGEGAPPAGEKAAESAADAVKSISLENVRQYYVNNEKIGQLFVIEGKAINNFDGPREMIKIQANLFDEGGVSLKSRDILAGNTVSLFQLQVLSQEELDAALSSQVGVLTNNANIKPGQSVPFMLVFSNPPEAVKEFGLRVIDAKPAKAAP